MLFETRQVPLSSTTNLRDMIDDDDLEDDIIVITAEEAENAIDLSTSSESIKDEDEEMAGGSGGSGEDDFNEISDAFSTMTLHGGPVFCSAIHPTGLISATGGQDEKVIVWWTSNGHVVKNFSGFQDSITDIGFSHDGKFLAAADMLGNVKVWKVNIVSEDEVNVEPYWSETIGDIQWMLWHQQACVLMAGDATGSTYLWNVPTQQFKVFAGEPVCSAASFMPDGKRAVIGSDKGNIRIVNLANCDIIGQLKLQEYSLNSIMSVACHPDNNIVAVGDDNGRMAFFSTQPSVKVHRVVNLKEEDDEMTNETCLENLIYLPSCLIATTDKKIYVWDPSKQHVRNTFMLDAGITKAIAVGKNLLAIASKVGRVFLVTPWPVILLVQTFNVHSDTVLSIAWAENKLLSSSEDKKAAVVEIPEFISDQYVNEIQNGVASTSQQNMVSAED